MKNADIDTLVSTFPTLSDIITSAGINPAQMKTLSNLMRPRTPIRMPTSALLVVALSFEKPPISNEIHKRNNNTSISELIVLLYHMYGTLYTKATVAMIESDLRTLFS